ncbi:MAG: PH domain-containing protein [Thermoleophilia bacterium]|nr:PH domain-containing protein [Thermoleophilia bacterium]
MAKDLDDLLASDESVVLETRQHWFVVVRQVIVRLLVLALLAVVIAYVTNADWLDGSVGDWLGRIGLIGFLAVAATVAWTVFGWLTESFYVTTHRVVYAHGILNRNVTTTPLVKIDEMTLRRPVLGRMLGFGRLEVENASGGREPLAGLEYLPQPTRLYQVIGDRARNQRMIEGGAHRDDDGDGFVDRNPAGRQAPVDRSNGDDDRWRPSGGSTTAGS